MSNERQPGYYRVNMGYEWRIGCWNGNEWVIPYISDITPRRTIPLIYDDDDLEEIIETPISPEPPQTYTAEERESYAKEREVMCLNIAKGCHDYNGGHHDQVTNKAFHHGIQTVINALEKFNENGLNDLQTRVIYEIGSSTPTGEEGKEG